MKDFLMKIEEFSFTLALQVQGGGRIENNIVHDIPIIVNWNPPFFVMECDITRILTNNNIKKNQKKGLTYSNVCVGICI